MADTNSPAELDFTITKTFSVKAADADAALAAFAEGKTTPIGLNVSRAQPQGFQRPTPQGFPPGKGPGAAAQMAPAPVRKQ